MGSVLSNTMLGDVSVSDAGGEIPAYAGMTGTGLTSPSGRVLDSRLRGNDGNRDDRTPTTVTPAPSSVIPA